MKKTKVLVVRFRRIGDALLTVALINSLKKSIPNVEIHYVLNDHIADLFTDHPNINKLIRFTKEDHSSFLNYVKKIRQVVKEEKYDMILDTRVTINTLLFPLFSLSSKYRIGQRKAYNRIFHNHRVDIDLKSSFIDQKLALLDPLSKEYKIEKDRTFDVYVSDEKTQQFRTYMESKGIDFNKPVMICTAVTRVESKGWHKDRMKAIVTRILHQHKDTQIILNYGDAKEKEMAYAIYQEMGCPKEIFINIAANTLKDLAAMLKNSDFLFGNEGGTRHISQALGIPSFAIFSPGNSINVWLPNRSDKYDGISSEEILTEDELETLPREDQFSSITEEKVWEALAPKLDRYLNKGSNKESDEA